MFSGDIPQYVSVNNCLSEQSVHGEDFDNLKLWSYTKVAMKMKRGKMLPMLTTLPLDARNYGTLTDLPVSFQRGRRKSVLTNLRLMVVSNKLFMINGAFEVKNNEIQTR